MVAWSAFYPDVLPELPWAPDPAVDQWLRNAAIEFFDRSKAYVVDLDAADAVANQMAYDLDLPSYTDLVEVVAVVVSGNPLDPASPQFLAGKFGDWSAEVGTPDYYTQQSMDGLLLVPAPSASAAAAIKIKAAVKPSHAAPSIENWLFVQWRQAITAGAKAKAMAEEGKPWSNPDGAMLNLSLFEGAISRATTLAANGFGRARPRFSGKFC